MEVLKNLYPISDFLYILQLEEYENKRYFKSSARLFWRRNLQKRGKLVNTKRIKLTRFMSMPLCLVFPFLTPLWIGIVNLILTPYFDHIKRSIRLKAKKFFSKYLVNTKVVVVAGSYGKTTTKNYIFDLVKYNYKTQMIPGNINTPTGIANWILSEFDPATELLIAEVDTYFVGEIRQSMSILPADIAVLTNIADQHLERFGSKKKLEKALMEVFEYSKRNAIKISGKSSNSDYAIEVAKNLDIPVDIIEDTVKSFKKPDRRGDVKIINGYSVVDNSYNISFETAIAAIDSSLLLAKKNKQKLVVILSGIPELGVENSDSNKKLGRYLVNKADHVILLKSILHNEVFVESNKFILAENLKEAWSKISLFGPKNHLILMFPELNDLYY